MKRNDAGSLLSRTFRVMLILGMALWTTSCQDRKPRPLGATVDRLGNYFKEVQFTDAGKVSSGPFAGYDLRVYEGHRKGKAAFDVELSAFSQGQTIYKLQTSQPLAQYFNNDGTAVESFMYQLNFAAFYAAATDTELQQVLSHTSMGKMMAAMGGEATQQPPAPWEAPSLEWANQCASLVKERAAGTRTFKVAGFAYSCRIGEAVQLEVVSENAHES